MSDEHSPHHRILNSLRLCQETVFPPVMGKLLHEAMQPDPDLHRLAEIIGLDPSLTATILALANSPYYKLTSPVSNIQRAAVVLGNKEIFKIVLFVSFQNNIQAHSSTQSADITGTWNAIIWSATASEILARHIDPADTSLAYLCALLKDLSRILLSTAGELPFPVKDLPTFSPEQAAVERKHWGTTHEYLTKELMDQWSLPEMCTEGILAHHDMEHLDQHPPLVQAVILGTRWAEVEFLHNGAAGPALQFHALAQKFLDLDDGLYAAIRQEVADRFRSMCETLNISMISTRERFFDYPIKSMQHFYFLSMEIQTAKGGLEAVAQAIGMHVKLYWGVEDWNLALRSPFSKKWAFFHNQSTNKAYEEIPEDQPLPWTYNGPIIDLWDDGNNIGAFRLCSRDGGRLSGDPEMDLYFRFASQNYALYLQRHAVMESKALILDTIPIGVAKLDAEGNILQANQHFASLCTGPRELPGRDLQAVMTEDFKYPQDRELARYFANHNQLSYARIFCPLGPGTSPLDACIYLVIHKHITGKKTEHIALIEDISKVRSIEFDMVKQRTFLHNLVSCMQDLVLTLDADGTITYVSPNASPALKGRNLFHIAKPSGLAVTSWDQTMLKNNSGPIEITLNEGKAREDKTYEFITSRLNETPPQYLVVGRDVSKIRRLEKQLKHQATFDSLTKVFNRYQFNITLTAETKKFARTGRSLGMIFFDVDNFKGFNDRYGHQAGDKVLANIGHILKQTTRKGMDIPCRYGGDEFVVLATEIAQTPLENLAKRIKESFDARYSKEMSLSIGVALLKKDETPEMFLLRADKASYTAKVQGGNALILAE